MDTTETLIAIPLALLFGVILLVLNALILRALGAR